MDLFKKRYVQSNFETAKFNTKKMLNVNTVFIDRKCIPKSPLQQKPFNQAMYYFVFVENDPIKDVCICCAV